MTVAPGPARLILNGKKAALPDVRAAVQVRRQGDLQRAAGGGRPATRPDSPARRRLLDGEPFRAPHIRFAVVPRGLRLALPPACPLLAGC